MNSTDFKLPFIEPDQPCGGPLDFSTIIVPQNVRVKIKHFDIGEIGHTDDQHLDPAVVDASKPQS